MKCLAIVMVPVLFAGCALIEPSARSAFSAKPGTSTEAVYACAESTIRSLKLRAPWSDVVTVRDVATGTFETGQFKKVNIEGIRAQIKYRPDTGGGRIKVKASGTYFSDLGADKAAAQLANGIAQCL